jgi:glycyl-tRNA synthetase
MEWYTYWKDTRLKWHKALGTNTENLKYHDHLKLAHYANAAVDIEYKFPFGFKEVEGIHSRTDFDLGRHQEFSGKKLQYFDPETNQNYVPYVVETSIGLDRLFLLQLCENLVDEVLENGETRTVFKINPVLAPYKVAILPLVKKDGLPEIAEKIYNDLKFDFNCFYEEKDTIGKRYRRQDAIGTPFCVTIDYDSVQDSSVTLRYRDSMEQKRIKIDELHGLISEEVSWKKLLNNL